MKIIRILIVLTAVLLVAGIAFMILSVHSRLKGTSSRWMPSFPPP